MNAMQFPLARITIGFILGILFANYAYFPAPFEGFSCLLLTFLFFLWAYYHSQKQLFQDRFFGIATYVLAFAIGMITLLVHSATYHKDNYIHQIPDSETEHTLEIVLREKWKPTAYCDRYIVLVNRIDGKPCNGRLLINFYKNSVVQEFRIGAELQIRSAILKPSAPLNPDQFDYGKYLRQKSILGQSYVALQNVKTNGRYHRDLFNYADRLRARILHNLEKNHFPNAELNVLAALILGQQQDIDPEIVKNYQFAGAVHILSVSGLHVGFILMFVQFLLQWIPNNRRNSYLKLGAVLISLWAFAILAGLSPSVVRSATMFSFLAIGMHLKRPTNVFHTLIVSLLLILLFEPPFLFDVGFQLSYLALFFILWVQPVFNGFWQPKNKIANYFWQILTVSFAAQLGTLPLSLYYFHQFPGLFFLTNLAVIPLLSLIMALGVLLMVLSATGWVPEMLGLVVQNLVFLLNEIIGKIAAVEQLVWRDIPFNTLMVISAYFFIAGLVLCWVRFSFKRVALALVGVLLFQGSYFASRWNIESQHQWIVFHLPKKTMIAEKTGNQLIAYTNADLAKKNPLHEFQTAHFCRLKAQRPIENLMAFGNKKILIVDRQGNYPKQVSPDVMLFRDSPAVNLERVFKTCKPKVLVADASNYKSYLALWKATCLKEKIPFHATDEKGYFKLEN